MAFHDKVEMKERHKESKDQAIEEERKETEEEEKWQEQKQGLRDTPTER